MTGTSFAHIADARAGNRKVVIAGAGGKTSQEHLDIVTLFLVSPVVSELKRKNIPPTSRTFRRLFVKKIDKHYRDGLLKTVPKTQYIGEKATRAQAWLDSLTVYQREDVYIQALAALLKPPQSNTVG